MLYTTASFMVLALSSSVSNSFIHTSARSRQGVISSRIFMSDESSTSAETSESAADMFASPPVLSTLSESGEIEIDFDSLGKSSSLLSFHSVPSNFYHDTLPHIMSSCATSMHFVPKLL